MKNLFTHFYLKNFFRNISFVGLLAVLTLTISTVKAQVISEGFEESGWSNTGVSGSATITVTETYGTAGTWAYKANSVVTAATAPAANAHSGNRALAYTSSSSSYLITPLITTGVSQVTLWVYPNGNSAVVIIGAGTNSTVTANTGSISSTGGGAWSLASSTYGTLNGLTTGTWNQVTFNIPASVTSNFTNPAYVKIQRSANNFQIDDIVITSPTSVTPPTVTTSNPVATSITESSAVLAGNITDVGGGSITVSGFCYSTSANPTTADSKTTDGPTGVGAIASTITGLSFSTTYHVRAYATGTAGTVYGDDVTFTTSAPSSPSLVVNPLSLAFGSVLIPTTSGEKTFTITGAGLNPTDGNITITAPTGYQVSATTGSGFATSIDIPYTGGTLATTTIYVHFSPTDVISYNDNISATGGGATVQNVAVTGSGTNIAYTVGDYKSVANANWGVATTWNKWDGTAWVTSSDFPNATTANVYIIDGYTVNDETSARSINNLYIDGNSTLKSSNKVNSPIYLKVYGSTVSVKSGSLIGNLSAGNDADGISLDVFGTGLTITGGGTINLSRIRTNTASTTITIDNDVTLNYHGSANAGNAAGFYTVAGDNNTLTINTGKTLTFAPWSCYTPISSSHTSGTFAQTININGTLTFVDGTVAGNTTANGWTGHTNNYMSLGITGKIFTLNIGATGTLNVSEFYPNGTKADNSPGTGDVTTINVAAGGVINISKIADFRNAGQIVSGAGTLNLLAGAKLRIGATAGITASASAGPVQTSTRSFSTAATYSYEGSAAQNSGDGLPANVSGLIINNAAGLTLNGSVQANDSLNLTNGTITSSASNMLTVGSAAATNGGSTASHVAGPLTKLTAGTAVYAFPVGKGGTYRPASITPATTDASSYTAEFFNTSGASTTSVATPVTSVGTSEYWDIRKNSGADAQITLNYDNTKTSTWSNSGAPDVNQDITVAHLIEGTWYDEVGTTGTTITGDLATGTIVSQVVNSFSPFTFGLKPHGTVPVTLVSFNATKAGNQTKLYWTNANELNTSTYIVEKSTDGKTFATIGSVNAAQNSSYSYIDETVDNGVAYYRLKITDKSGAFRYSSIIAVNNRALATLSIFPNPAVNTLYISHEKAANGAKVEIFTMDGKKISDLRVMPDAVQTSVNVSTLPKGNYNLVFINGLKYENIRFVKQ